TTDVSARFVRDAEEVAWRDHGAEHVRPDRRPLRSAEYATWPGRSVRVARGGSLRPDGPVPAREQHRAAGEPAESTEAAGKIVNHIRICRSSPHCERSCHACSGCVTKRALNGTSATSWTSIAPC